MENLTFSTTYTGTRKKIIIPAMCIYQSQTEKKSQHKIQQSAILRRRYCLAPGTGATACCVLSHFAVWLEYHFQLNPEENEFFFGVHGYNDPVNIKQHALYHLRKLTTCPPST